MANTPDYSINYDDERFNQVDADKDQAIADLDNVYGGMIGSSDQYFDKQIQATKDWGDTQTQIQQQQTDFTIDQINQQKDQAKKDYVKEQSGAYVDWQKQSNQYGVGAEKMASAGLTNTGYSESSQVSMYNTYQNRMATAREVFNQAVLNYNNSIKEAQLQNSAALAEIAFQTLLQTLELSLQGFQYKNQLILERANKKIELDNIYYNRYLDVLQQINTENALAEDIRQFNESLAWEKEQEKNKSSSTTSNNSSNTTKPSSTPNSSSGNNIVGTVNKPSGTSNESNSPAKTPSTKTPFEQNKNATNNAKSGFTGTTYEQANAYLRKNGVSGFNLMTRGEWTRRKASYKSSGIGGYEVSANGSYVDYLRTATEYAIKNK